MAMKLIRTQAGDGIFVNLIKDDRFKHNRIAVNFIPAAGPGKLPPAMPCCPS